MSKMITVQEVLASIEAKKNEKGKTVLNRFNKQKFESLLKAMFNDSKFSTKVAKISKGKLESVEEIEVSKGFRKFCKKVCEKAGIDKAESEKLLSADFTIDSAEGIYEFFATAMYLYMDKGNKFDLLQKEDFKGSVYVRDVEGKKGEWKDTFHPRTREPLGKSKVDTQNHKVLGIKSSCPSFLKDRQKKDKK